MKVIEIGPDGWGDVPSTSLDLPMISVSGFTIALENAITKNGFEEKW